MTAETDKTTAPPDVGESEQTRTGCRVLQTLFGAIKAAAVYEANNRAYRSRAKELERHLKDYFECYGSLRIDYFNDFFFINKVRLKYGLADFPQDRELAAQFEELQLGRLEFFSAPDSDLLDRTLIALAQIDRHAEDRFQALQTVWEKLHLEQISIGPLALKTTDLLSMDSEVVDTSSLNRSRAGRLFNEVNDLIQEFEHRIQEAEAFDTTRAKRVVHDLIDHLVNDEASLLEFTAIKDFDDYTYAHSANVGIFSIALGLRLGLDKRRLSQLGFAALFHDVGKVRLPAELIKKPEKYNEDDWEMMRRHPILGALTMAMLPAIDQHNARSVLVAYEHHMAPDGSGYPQTGTPRESSLFSRIVSLVDAYDAMTSGRVYMKTKVSPDEALNRMIKQSGRQFDPILLRALVHVLGIFPVGTFVRLSTGESGIVKNNDPDDLYCPEVLILRDAQGNAVDGRSTKLIATDPQTGEYLAHITEITDENDIGMSVREALGLTENEAVPTGE